MSELQRVPKAKWHVLLVDDDDYALVIERALRAAAGVPVEIRRARTGEEALALVRDSAPDLLLLDLKMSGMGGDQALEEIKRDDALRSVPVAILSPYDRDEDVARSYGLGGNHFHHKAEQSSGARGEAWRPASEPHGIESDPSWVVGFLDDDGQRREPPFDGCAKGASLGGGRGRVDRSIHLRKGFRGVLARWR